MLSKELCQTLVGEEIEGVKITETSATIKTTTGVLRFELFFQSPEQTPVFYSCFIPNGK